MNAFQELDQMSGNSWESPLYPMLHESIFDRPTLNVNHSYANAMFNSMERQMRVGETELQDSLKLLREKYVFNNPEAVEAFINTHRMITPILIEAAAQFAGAFDNRALLALEIAPDETPQSIYALAMWSYDIDRARSALRAFDDGWLAKNLDAINGRVVFDYELV